MSPRFEADIAVSLPNHELADLEALPEQFFMWTAWKNRHWPLDVVQPGLRFYAFNTATRRLEALMQVTRGGSYSYRTRREITREVRRLTGWSPAADDPYWQRVPVPVRPKVGHGIAMRWTVLKPTDLQLDVRFPQLGWLILPALDDDQSMDRAFAEGDRRLQSVFRYERSAKLRIAAKAYWQHRLGKLHCLVCGFDFTTMYGQLGDSYIEMHHDIPLWSTGRRETRPRDLKPVCANCHKMAHRVPEKVLTVATLKRIVTRTR